MINYIKELARQIAAEGLMSYKEEDHYYIVSESDTNTFILLQDRNNCVVVWSFDSMLIELTLLIDLMISIFERTIIFPYVENERDKKVLEQKNFIVFDYYDDDLDEEQKNYPSYMREIR